MTMLLSVWDKTVLPERVFLGMSPGIANARDVKQFAVKIYLERQTMALFKTTRLFATQEGKMTV